MTIGAQALAVYPGERYGGKCFLTREPQHLGDYSSRSHFYQHDMIQPDLVKRIFQGNAALDFVRLDHAGEDSAHGKRCFACGDGVA